MFLMKSSWSIFVKKNIEILAKKMIMLWKEFVKNTRIMPHIFLVLLFTTNKAWIPKKTFAGRYIVNEK